MVALRLLLRIGDPDATFKKGCNGLRMWQNQGRPRPAGSRKCPCALCSIADRPSPRRSRSCSLTPCISCGLSRHRRARRYTLRIHAATREVVLTMPPRGSVREARAFAEKHGGWIATRASRVCRRRCRSRPAPLCRSATCRTASCIGAANAAPCGSRSTRTAIRLVCVAGEAPHVARRVRDFLRREVRRDLEVGEPALCRDARRHRQAGRGPRSSRAAGARARPPACCRSPGA